MGRDRAAGFAIGAELALDADGLESVLLGHQKRLLSTEYPISHGQDRTQPAKSVLTSFD
jgi:hypothetical protein